MQSQLKQLCSFKRIASIFSSMGILFCAYKSMAIIFSTITLVLFFFFFLSVINGHGSHLDASYMYMTAANLLHVNDCSKLERVCTRGAPYAIYAK